jgi:hypothetical protein
LSSEMILRVTMSGKVKSLDEAEAKASLNQGTKLRKATHRESTCESQIGEIPWSRADE